MTPDAIVHEVARLYAQLQALPVRQHPAYLKRNGPRAGSATYQRLAGNIRRLSALHWQRVAGATITNVSLSQNRWAAVDTKTGRYCKI